MTISFLDSSFEGPGRTFWQKFIAYNLHQALPLIILGLMLIIETNSWLLFKKKVIFFVAGCFVSGVLGTIVLMIINEVILDIRFTSFIETLVSIAGIAFVFPLLLEFIDKRLLIAEQLYENSRAELIGLKSQVQPHFLYNALNTLYGAAMTERAPKTASGIETLATLMRYVLSQTSSDFVPVKHEFSFIKEYIQLQKMRLPEYQWQGIRTEIQPEVDHNMIAPMLLIPFIENAFKFGITVEKECRINLLLVVKNGHLTLNLKNSVVHLKAGAGTGVANVRRRLELLYPGRHHLEITHTPSEYSVILKLNLKKPGIQYR